MIEIGLTNLIKDKNLISLISKNKPVLIAKQQQQLQQQLLLLSKIYKTK